jgi:predicted RNA-binding protein with PUA-like domain
MNFWLVKSEPFVYSWTDLQKDGKTAWEGVRNYAARNNLQAMRKDDMVLFYHSMDELRIMGIAKVLKEHYQDPSTDEAAWVAVDLIPFRPFPKPVTLQEVKKETSLKNMELVKISRLSVSKVRRKEFEILCRMGGLSI